MVSMLNRCSRSILGACIVVALYAGMTLAQDDETAFMQRSESQTSGNVRVTSAVPGADETRALFGRDLYKSGVQPIWLEVENRDTAPVRLLPIGIDPEYFTSIETALIHSGRASDVRSAEGTRFFYERGMEIVILPGETRSGYVFTQPDEGTKDFIVDLLGDDGEMRSLAFFINVPGLRIDHHAVDFDALYPETEVRDLDMPELRRELASFTCCTTDKAGKGQGDPLNLVVIGSADDVYRAFIRSGWDETETIYGASLLKTGRSFIFGGAYRYSPVSALYVFERGQDVAFQKARDNIHERNHLRLWLAPFTVEGVPVWIGQISRDIGVRFTTKTITTHKIDPDVDETRDYLQELLWYQQAISRFAYVEGVGPAPLDAPRGNLTGDPYYTDGKRVVLWVSAEPVVFTDVEFLEWEDPWSPGR